MKHYTTLDGKIFITKTKDELVQSLMDDLRLPINDKRQFMEGMARWCRVHNEGAMIRTRNTDVFVDDLIANQFLTVQEYH